MPPTSQLAGRARPGALISAATALLLSGILLSGPLRAEEGAGLAEPQDGLAAVAGGETPAPRETLVEVGGGEDGGADSETARLRTYVRGEAIRRTSEQVFSLATGELREAGALRFGSGFRLNSTLGWGEERGLEGGLTAVIPIKTRATARGDKPGKRTAAGTFFHFLQPGVVFWRGDKDERRADVSLGYGLRYLTFQRSLIGGSLFYDRGRFGHRRLTAGLEWQDARTLLGVSYYLPLSDERSGFEGRREEVVGGWTASLERRLGRRLALEASAESWSAKTKDTSTGGKLGASYDLAPGLSLYGRHAWRGESLIPGEGYEAGLELRLPAKRTARFGPLAGLDPYRPVAREERIVTEVVSEGGRGEPPECSFTDSSGTPLTTTSQRSTLTTTIQRSTSEQPLRIPLKCKSRSGGGGEFYFRVDYGGNAVPGTDYSGETRRLKISADNEDYSLPFTIHAATGIQQEKVIRVTLTEINQAEYEALASPELSSGQAYYSLRSSQTEDGRAVFELIIRLAASGNPTLETGSLQLALDPLTASPNEDPASDGDPPATVSFTVSLQDKDGIATTHALADLQYELVAFNRSATYGEDFSFASDDSPETISGGAKVVATLKAGEGSNTHVVTILDDEEAELAESFYIGLAPLLPADPDLVFVTNTNAKEATVTIAASDEVSERPETVELTIAPSDVSGLDENAADPADRRITATATLSRAPGAGEEVVVPLRVVPRTGSAGASADDYELAPAEGEITISGTDTSGTLTLTIVDDEETEATERFTLTLGELPSGWVAKEGTPSAYNFAVSENDPPEGARCA